MEDDGKIHKLNMQDVNISYLVNELIRHLPNETAFGCTTKYQAHPKLMKALHWSLSSKVLLDIKDSIVNNNGKDDQTILIQSISVPDTHTKHTTKYVGTDSPVHVHNVHKPLISSVHACY